LAKQLKKLVIVESPAKARKIGGYLGDDYIVEASIGHIRDLPQRAADIPKEVKKFAWSREGVDIENGFAPLYVINPDKKQKVQELKELLKESEELILATDEDREGEAIAWHLMEILKPKVPVKRMVFNEITKEAILKARTRSSLWISTFSRSLEKSHAANFGGPSPICSYSTYRRA